MEPSINVRNGAARTRPRMRWEMDPSEEVAFIPRAFGVLRDRPGDLRSVANMQRLGLLQEIYPTVDIELLADVLVAAQYRVDVAASLLSDLNREVPASGSEGSEDTVIVDLNDIDDSCEWHTVDASRPELQQWEVIHDDWEILDASDRVDKPSFADIVKAQLTVNATVLSRTQHQKQRPAARRGRPQPMTDFGDVDQELCVKSFGTRKLRNRRKYHR